MIGVEPSGDPFNSIRLNAENHPFNPMVNAGAIACSGLVHEAKGAGAFEHIRRELSRFAGRDLGVDEAVYESESPTGDRNRAIGYLLRTNAVIKDNVAEVLDVYFRQCAILVTARDVAIMAATLANRGINPVTGEQVTTPYAIARTLSVMTSSGMYDYAGEWIYRDRHSRQERRRRRHPGGASGAARARQLLAPPRQARQQRARHQGLRGTVAALRPAHAQPQRRCAQLHHRRLHHRQESVAPQPQAEGARHPCRPSPGRPRDRAGGNAVFSNVDYVSRKLAARPRPQFVIFDLRRVTAVTRAGARLIAEEFRELANFHVTVILSGIKRSSDGWKLVREWTEGVSNLRDFYLLDAAIEWAEDQVVYRYGGSIDFHDTTELSEQPLLAGLSADELAELATLGTTRTYRRGEKIVGAGEPATSLFFLQKRRRSVTLPDGVRLATLTAGMAFGEMALLEAHRSADVLADASATAVEMSIADFERFRDQHPKAGERIMRNLAQFLAERLIVANTKVNLLTAN